MDEQKNTTQTQDATQPKLPYEEPQIIYRAPLEAAAAQCNVSGGKADLSCTIAGS